MLMVNRGGGIDSIAFLHEFVAELKKANRKLISNCYLSEARIGLYIDKDNLFYTYVPMKYLNIWHKERDFVRLYYYIADLDFYEIPDIDVKIVCDQFYQKETEKAVAVNTALLKVGLNKYALFYKWTNNKKRLNIEFSNNIIIKNGIWYGFIEMLEENFDIYSDYLPEKDYIREFLKDRICYSAILKEQKVLVGGLVIDKRGDVQTEEFIFVDKAYRGNRIATQLQNFWYINAEDKTKFIAWIRENNNESIRLHINSGFVKEQAYKITMMKG